MKYPLLTILFFIVLYGCTDKADFSAQKPCTPTLNTTNDDNHFVDLNLVVSYANSRGNKTKAETNSYTIKPYCSAYGDTLLYIINYGANDGWQVLSSDTRTPAIIAEGYNGRFSMEEGSDGLRLWMGQTAADIETIRNAKDEDLAFTAADIRVSPLMLLINE